VWHFLKEHYELSNNTVDLSDILSASESMDWNESGVKTTSQQWNGQFPAHFILLSLNHTDPH